MGFAWAAVILYESAVPESCQYKTIMISEPFSISAGKSTPEHLHPNFSLNNTSKGVILLHHGGWGQCCCVFTANLLEGERGREVKRFDYVGQPSPRCGFCLSTPPSLASVFYPLPRTVVSKLTTTVDCSFWLNVFSFLVSGKFLWLYVSGQLSCGVKKKARTTHHNICKVWSGRSTDKQIPKEQCNEMNSIKIDII